MIGVHISPFAVKIYTQSSSPSLERLMTSYSFIFSSSPAHWRCLILTWILISHQEAVQSVCRAAPGGEWGLWYHRSHYQSWWPENPVWATPLDPPAYRNTHQHTVRWAWWKQVKLWHIAENVLNYSISQGVGVVVVVSSEPHLTVGCSGGESTQCRPWCPRLTLCSTPLLSDPGPGG